jgi:ArsR family transcriptional regulator
MDSDNSLPQSAEFAFNMKAGYLAAFSHPLRLQIIDALRHQSLSVNEISRRLRAPQPTVSKHLALLRQQGVVATRPAGVTVYYSLADREVLRFLRIISTILEKKLNKSQAVLAQLARERP